MLVRACGRATAPLHLVVTSDLLVWRPGLTCIFGASPFAKPETGASSGVSLLCFFLFLGTFSCIHLSTVSMYHPFVSIKLHPYEEQTKRSTMQAPLYWCIRLGLWIGCDLQEEAAELARLVAAIFCTIPSMEHFNKGHVPASFENTAMNHLMPYERGKSLESWNAYLFRIYHITYITPCFDWTWWIEDSIMYHPVHPSAMNFRTTAVRHRHLLDFRSILAFISVKWLISVNNREKLRKLCRNHQYLRIITSHTLKGKIYGVSKNRGYSKSSILKVFSINYRPSIFRYPYFWKHPCTKVLELKDDEKKHHWDTTEEYQKRFFTKLQCSFSDSWKVPTKRTSRVWWLGEVVLVLPLIFFRNSGPFQPFCCNWSVVHVELPNNLLRDRPSPFTNQQKCCTWILKPSFKSNMQHRFGFIPYNVGAYQL